MSRWRRLLSRRKSELKKFIQHCCVHQHYFFVVKKCGCTICNTPTRRCWALSRVSQIQYLLRTVITNPSVTVWAPKTDESHRPSLQKKAQRYKTLPFTASVQHVINVDLMLQCDECGLRQLLHSKQKERENLQGILEDYSFTCGALTNTWTTRSLGECKLEGPSLFWASRKALL